MNNRNIIESSGESLYIKERGIPKGCELCLKGAKTVLFLNGICQLPNHCSWYCPISKKRKGNTLTYANEISIRNKKELLNEIKIADSEGMSITGGEPLSIQNLKLTLDYIQYIKSKIGEDFHIHLYTNSLNFSPDIAKLLENSGLDEIRFHPPSDNWKAIEFALTTNMSIGAEVPVIPQEKYLKTLKKFIYYLDSVGAEFINLNEFEYCFSNSEILKKRGFELEKGTIASVKGSNDAAFNLIKDLNEKTSLKIHYCRIITKDFFQLKNRYLRRAKNIRKEYEEITEEGLLLYAEITGSKENLNKFYEFMIKKAQFPSHLIALRDKKIKIPYYIAIEEEISDLLEKYNLKAFIIETTPFRRTSCRQITERTPIDIFKEEYYFYEDED